MYLPARWAKINFSGEHFTTVKFWTTFGYNFLPGYIHLQFVMLSTLPFYGHADNSIIELFSLIMAGMHACALPSPGKKRSFRLNFKKIINFFHGKQK